MAVVVCEAVVVGASVEDVDRLEPPPDARVQPAAARLELREAHDRQVEAARDRLVLDGRNALDAEAFADAGLTLLQVGRRPIAARQPVVDPVPRIAERSAVGVPA